MSIETGGGGVNPFGAFRLENLFSIVSDEAEKLEVKFGGVGRASLMAELSRLKRDAQCLIQACEDGETDDLTVLDASEGRQDEFCVRADFYEFYFVRADGAASWYVLAYLKKV